MVGVGEGAGLIREFCWWGRQKAQLVIWWAAPSRHPPPLYLSIPCPPETLELEEGHGVGKISLFSPPAWSPEGNRRVEITKGFGNQKNGAQVLAL